MAVEAYKKIAALQGRPTYYEVALIKGDTRILLQYVHRVTRQSVLKAAQKFGPKLVDLMGVTDETPFSWKPNAVAHLGDWTIRSTGRTEREAITNGELPFIGNLDNIPA